MYRSIKTLYYWSVLFATLLVADDAIFGWFFWLLSQVHPLVSAAAALAIYWAVGYWLTIRGMKPHPGPVASWLLNRLRLERKNPELKKREQLLRQKLSTVAASVPITLLFGGVVTTLWLCRHGIIDGNSARARRLGFWLAGIYAVEFALIHSFGIGGTIFWFRQ